MVALFQTGDFTLASGARSTWKIECDALTSSDWDGLAAMLAVFLPEPFGTVLGVPRGGLPFADALRKHARPEVTDRLLVVDDVWTTGGSMARFVKTLNNNRLLRAVVFARHAVPDGVTALFQMPDHSAAWR